MTWIDLHCDTIYELMRCKDAQSLRNNTLSVDAEGLRRAKSAAQFFAMFVYAEDFRKQDCINWDKAYQHALAMLVRAKDEVKANADVLAMARNASELRHNMSVGKVSAFLTVEEGGILNGKMERLEALYIEGVRLITLTWNYENSIGYPNRMQQGLKPFGFEVIAEMNRKGMIIDVSHLSDGGFWDVVKYSRAPIVASHSNARALCPHPRNLTDEMIRVLAGKGGIAGVNFYPYFLNGKEQAGVEELVQHIRHMFRVGGEDFVALGTDFDGFDDATNELDHVSKLSILYEALKKSGFQERQLEKFCYGNAERVIRDVCR